MNIVAVIPELVVRDVIKSIEFYHKVLGFTVDAKSPESGLPKWAQLSFGNVTLMMQDLNETCEEIQSFSRRIYSSAMFVVKFDNRLDVRKLFESLERDYAFFMPLRETDYGTVEFGVYDPDDYMIIISG